MNKRIISIIDVLVTEEPITLEQLSSRFQVSKRTMRNDIHAVNELLAEQGLNPVSLEKEQIVRQSDFKELQKSLGAADLYSYKLSKNERILYASAFLISATDYITLNTIAESLYVSRATIINDLDGIKKILRDAQLELISYPNKGLWVQGRESLKRKFMLAIVSRNHMMIVQDKENGTAAFSLQSGDLVTIQKILLEQEKLHGYHLTEDSYQTVVNYIRIMIQRNTLGEYIEPQGHISAGRRYRMAQDILKYVSQYCKNPSTEDEILYFSQMLEQVRYLKQKEVLDKNTIKVQFLTRQLIEVVSEELAIDLSADYDFYENLSNHLLSMFGDKADYLPHNESFRMIIENNPAVFAAVKKHSAMFQPYVKREIKELELIYLAIHICAAIERKKTQDIAFHVVLACNGGIGTSQLLLARLKKHFNFKVVDIISSHEAALVTEEQADLIISTIELKECQIDHIVVTPMLNDEDYIRIGSKIDTIRNTRRLPVRSEQKEISVKGILKVLKPLVFKYLGDEYGGVIDEMRIRLEEYLGEQNTEDVFSPYLHHLLTEDFIKLDVECRDWQEAVRASADILLKKGYIEPRYIDAMIHNIEENGPYIVISQGFAFPHEGLEMGTLKLGMSFIRLKTPIPFGEEEFDPVEFVCCLSAVDHKSHLKAFFHLVNMLQKDAFKKMLHKAAGVREVIQLIEQFEYETE